jgi:uncharacterized SAM-dependent methyltransferase
MELCSLRAQTVHLAGEAWSFAAGEPLVTEHSVKYSLAAFAALAERAGWRPAATWSDPRGDLSLCALVPGAAPVQADSKATHAGESQP